MFSWVNSLFCIVKLVCSFQLCADFSDGCSVISNNLNNCSNNNGLNQGY